MPRHKVKAKEQVPINHGFKAGQSLILQQRGAKIAELPGFANTENGVAIFGEYNGVRLEL